MFLERCLYRAFDQMGQKNHYEQDGSNQHERSEQPQIAQSGSGHGHQTQECPDRSDVADQKRRYDFAQGAADVGRMAKMGQQMQRIIDGDAYDDRSDSEDNHRNLVANQRQAAQGE